MHFLVDYWIRSAILLAVAALAVLSMRRSSAARRHLIWLAALAALLTLPLMRHWTPRWDAPAAAEVLAALPMRTVVNVTADRPTRSRLPGILTAIWITGAALVLLRYGRAQWRASRLVEQSTPFDGDDVRVSPGVSVPMVCGVARPVILLPPAAREWPAGQLRSVLAHERMHVGRRDLVGQTIAHVACAMYWPQPLVWLAAAAMRGECEQACDDGVLARGTSAPDYAGHLVSIARALSVERTAYHLGGIAMTRTSQLHRRIAALLDPSVNRVSAGARFGAGALAAALLMLVSTAAIDAPLLAQAGQLGGTVRDASGATVPRARVDVTAADGAFHEVAYSNDAGEFSLSDVPDGAYDVTVAKEGFARLSLTGMKFDRAAKPLDVTLQVGMIRERMQVSADRNVANPSTAAGPPKRVRVGGNVQHAKLLHRVPPLYPPTAKADGAQGTVLLKAVIGLDGSIVNLEPINRQVDKRLVDAATDAVKQWRYSPTLLNGQPVEVLTEVEVNFTLLP